MIKTIEKIKEVVEKADEAWEERRKFLEQEYDNLVQYTLIDELNLLYKERTVKIKGYRGGDLYAEIGWFSIGLYSDLEPEFTVLLSPIRAFAISEKEMRKINSTISVPISILEDVEVMKEKDWIKEIESWYKQ